jgi:regulatory protein
MRVIALDSTPRGRLITLRLDSAPDVSLSLVTALQFRLRRGDDLTPAQLAEITLADRRQAAFDSALRLLSYGRRSEMDLRKRLARRAIGRQLIDEAVERLRGLSLLDDCALAASRVDSLERLSPRGPRLLVAELLTEGINRATAEAAVATVDESGAAYRAAVRRARALQHVDDARFCRRLSDFLLRCGFDHDIIARTVSRLRREGRDSACRSRRLMPGSDVSIDAAYASEFQPSARGRFRLDRRI